MLRIPLPNHCGVPSFQLTSFLNSQALYFNPSGEFVELQKKFQYIPFPDPGNEVGDVEWPSTDEKDIEK